MRTGRAARQSHARGAATASGCKKPDPPHTGPAGGAGAGAGGA
jgi:hypothetical protein